MWASVVSMASIWGSRRNVLIYFNTLCFQLCYTLVCLLCLIWVRASLVALEWTAYCWQTRYINSSNSWMPVGKIDWDIVMAKGGFEKLLWRMVANGNSVRVEVREIFVLYGTLTRKAPCRYNQLFLPTPFSIHFMPVFPIALHLRPQLSPSLQKR